MGYVYPIQAQTLHVPYRAGFNIYKKHHPGHWAAGWCALQNDVPGYRPNLRPTDPEPTI